MKDPLSRLIQEGLVIVPYWEIQNPTGTHQTTGFMRCLPVYKGIGRVVNPDGFEFYAIEGVPYLPNDDFNRRYGTKVDDHEEANRLSEKWLANAAATSFHFHTAIMPALNEENTPLNPS